MIIKFMRKWLVYVLGVVTGFILAVLLAFLLNGKSKPVPDVIGENGTETEESSDGIKLFDEPSDIIEERSFEVFQVIAENAALVKGKGGGRSIYRGPVYLIVNHDGKYYYDDEKIETPKGKVARQIGIYQYPTRNDFVKTVPIIEIMDE